MRGPPTALAIEAVEQLVETLDDGSHSVARAYGFQAEPLAAESGGVLGVEEGLLVTAVWRGSAAFAGGLRPGDVVTSVAGEPPSLAAFLPRPAKDETPAEAAEPQAEDSPAQQKASEQPAAQPVLELDCVRWGRKRKVVLDPAAGAGRPFLPGGLRLAAPTPGVEVGTVLPSSPVALVGVRTGRPAAVSQRRARYQPRRGGEADRRLDGEAGLLDA